MNKETLSVCLSGFNCYSEDWQKTEMKMLPFSIHGNVRKMQWKGYDF